MTPTALRQSPVTVVPARPAPAALATLSDAAPASVGTDDLLAAARAAGAAEGLPFAGRVSPRDAYTLFVRGDARLVDVRSGEERQFVGHVPGSLHVPWMTGTALTRNPRFARELEAKTGKQVVVLLLCRSGKRSAAAATEAHKAGFTNVFNVSEGFEGDLDDQQQRGHHNGWRFHGLPWVQD